MILYKVEIESNADFQQRGRADTKIQIVTNPDKDIFRFLGLFEGLWKNRPVMTAWIVCNATYVFKFECIEGIPNFYGRNRQIKVLVK